MQLWVISAICDMIKAILQLFWIIDAKLNGNLENIVSRIKNVTKVHQIFIWTMPPPSYLL